MKGNFSAAKDDLAPSPMGLFHLSGFVGTLATTTYIAIFVGPHWDTLIIEPARMAIVLYVRDACLCRAFASMWIAQHIDSICRQKWRRSCTGVNKAIQTISVFIVSALVSPVGRIMSSNFHSRKAWVWRLSLAEFYFIPIIVLKVERTTSKGIDIVIVVAIPVSAQSRVAWKLRNLGQSRTESLSNRVATKLSNALGKSSGKLNIQACLP